MTAAADAFAHDGETLAEVEAEWIRLSLARHGGNRTETARQLGISRRALHYKLRRVRHGE